MTVVLDTHMIYFYLILNYNDPSALQKEVLYVDPCLCIWILLTVPPSTMQERTSTWRYIGQEILVPSMLIPLTSD